MNSLPLARLRDFSSALILDQSSRELMPAPCSPRVSFTRSLAHVSIRFAFPSRLVSVVGGWGHWLLPVGLAGNHGRGFCHRSPAAPLVYPLVDERWSQPDGYLRSETRPRQWGAIQRNPDLDSRHPNQRAPAPTCQEHGTGGPDPLHAHEGSGPRTGELSAAYGPSPRRPRAIPHARFRALQGTGPPRRRIAQFREHRSVSGLESGGVRTGVLGAAVRAADRRGKCQIGR